MFKCQLVSMLWFILVIYDVQMSVSFHVMVYFGNLWCSNVTVSMLWFILVIYDVQMSQLVSILWFILVIYDVQMSQYPCYGLFW